MPTDSLEAEGAKAPTIEELRAQTKQMRQLMVGRLDVAVNPQTLLKVDLGAPKATPISSCCCEKPSKTPSRKGVNYGASVLSAHPVPRTPWVRRAESWWKHRRRFSLCRARSVSNSFQARGPTPRGRGGRPARPRQKPRRSPSSRSKSSSWRRVSQGTWNLRLIR